jgi:hypothetical protein
VHLTQYRVRCWKLGPHRLQTGRCDGAPFGDTANYRTGLSNDVL